MRKFVCCPPNLIPEVVPNDVEYISLYSSIEPKEGVGYVASHLKKDVRRAGISPSVQAWDFTSIALSVSAVDESCARIKTADGWTRQIEVTIYLRDPSAWLPQINMLEKTCRFLTGDFWKFNFLEGGEAPPQPSNRQRREYEADCISLLSGGVDSFVGAIDLTMSDVKPLFVSKIVTGDQAIQRKIAIRLGAEKRFLQWSCRRFSPGEKETSTRGRSIIFFAYAVLAASALKSTVEEPVKIYVPENGFISLNVALNVARLGTLSTKTTHPVYLKNLQDVWEAVGIHARLVPVNDYCFKTKGEILSQCLDKDILTELIGETTSCGRYGHYKKTHCGRCIPCLVRRAAFLKAGISDRTRVSAAFQRQYVFDDLYAASQEKGSADIHAIAEAYLYFQKKGINRFVGSALLFSSFQDRGRYLDMIARGLDEVAALLREYGVL